MPGREKKVIVNPAHPKHHSQAFFNQGSTAHRRVNKAQQTTPEEPLLNSTNIFLKAILNELILHNDIELTKLHEKKEKKQKELEEIKCLEEEDKANFEENIRPTMYL